KISLGGDIVPSLGGGVAAMATSSGRVYAVLSPDPFHGKADELYSSPVSRDAWARAGTMTGDPGAVLAVSGTAAWFGTSNAETAAGTLWATADGVTWHKYPFRCPGNYFGHPYALAGIAAASRSDVAFLCGAATGMYHTGMEVLVSVNGGRTGHLTAQAPPNGGDVAGFAVPPARPAVITIALVSPGPDALYRTASAGKTWAVITVPGTGGGTSLSSLAYASPATGW